ncbi:MAG: hypothetical protein GY711_06475 [bacterium]|nr:hypothetical protein [bacterium]
MTESTSPKKGGIAATVVRVACLWVLAGALFKLFKGRPSDLPESVRSFFGSELMTFRIAIAAELCIVILCLLKPAWGWVPLVLLFLVFDVVLAPLVASGAESCGCFGSDVPITPLMMMSVDTVLLLAVLASRPWRMKRKKLQPLILLPLFAFATAAPFLKIQEGRLADPVDPTAPVDDGSPPSPVEGDNYLFETDSWSGSVLHDTDLARFIDADMVPFPSHVVLYRQTCEVCAEHLKELTLQPPADGNPIVLIRIVENGDTPENEVTKVKPDGATEFEIRALARGYGNTTPISFEIDDTLVIGEVTIHEH